MTQIHKHYVTSLLYNHEAMKKEKVAIGLFFIGHVLPN